MTACAPEPTDKPSEIVSPESVLVVDDDTSVRGMVRSVHHRQGFGENVERIAAATPRCGHPPPAGDVPPAAPPTTSPRAVFPLSHDLATRVRRALYPCLNDGNKLHTYTPPFLIQ